MLTTYANNKDTISFILLLGQPQTECCIIPVICLSTKLSKYHAYGLFKHFVLFGRASEGSISLDAENCRLYLMQLVRV